MVVALEAEGLTINRKHVQRLMQVMGIEGMAPGPSTSKPHPQHAVFPYLLRGLTIDRPNQVWSTDITYIRLRTGFVYLAAILDWYSLLVLAWELSISREVGFCLAGVERALADQRPEIFNTDHGV